MTFSGNFKIGKQIKLVNSILTESGFSINWKKLRTKKQSQAQRVTGIVVNKILQAPKDIRRNFRRDVYYIHKYGLESHLRKAEINRNNYLEHLIGVGNFICFVNKNDNRAKGDLKYLKEFKNKLKNNSDGKNDA